MSERGKRVVRVLLDRERDADVVERIERQGSITGYLRTLVRRDIHDERLDYAAMKAAEYQAENEKLRERIKELEQCIRGDAEGIYRLAKNTGYLHTDELMKSVHNRMKELGVEA